MLIRYIKENGGKRIGDIVDHPHDGIADTLIRRGIACVVDAADAADAGEEARQESSRMQQHEPSKPSEPSEPSEHEAAVANPRRRGRPPGSKNKPKEQVAQT